MNTNWIGRRQRGGWLPLAPADAPHVFTATSEEPARVLVIYAPPYGESPLTAKRH